LSTRIERRLKAWRERRNGHHTTQPPAIFDLEPIYRALARPDPSPQVAPIRAAFRLASSSAEDIDATVAALAAAVATGHRPRAEGLLAFLELCYAGTDLDYAAERLGAHLQQHGIETLSVLAGLDYADGWGNFAASVRATLKSVPPLLSRSDSRWPDLPPRRVVLRPSGGFGNQLFQYTAASAYARRIGAPLRLDLAEYEGFGTHREFLLGRLRIPIRRANSLAVLRTRLRPHRELRGSFDDFLFEEHGSRWLTGFWEDPAYFAGIWPKFRERIRPRNPATEEAAAALVEKARIAPGPVVGIHLRRGDRGPGGHHHAPFSTLPPKYCRLAAGRFPADSHFLVFSDTAEDIAWCRANLGLADTAHVTFGEGRDPILDFFALTRSDHLILSSGTFSWWAGYLGQQPGKRVIVPNVLQGLSANLVVVPPPIPPQPGWEEITLAPGDIT
jgi:hypothetical protein